jgi:hypothetical protein
MLEVEKDRHCYRNSTNCPELHDLSFCTPDIQVSLVG